ncbi:hypothetical protein PCANB_002679 [Pneumocystis canis]|nr:hypothetical protein PCK1_002679 [Pneumocystis canis]KAG5438574.1 hypothetical protein PCANB_002679 [Pneumocystis canis]
MNWQINYSFQDVLRMITIIGGYLLIRPYLQRWVSRKQVMEYEMTNQKDAFKKTDEELNNQIIENIEEEFAWGFIWRKKQKEKIENDNEIE